MMMMMMMSTYLKLGNDQYVILSKWTRNVLNMSIIAIGIKMNHIF